MTDLFETAMNFAEKVDKLIGGRGMRIVALILLIVVLLAYASVPSPYEPMMPCPQDGTKEIGLEPSLWWVGGGPAMPVFSGFGLDPNTKITYEVLLGTGEDDLAIIGTAAGGRSRGNLQHNLTEPLLPGTDYVWQIKAVNRLNKKSESPMWHFSTRAAPTIERFQSDRIVLDRGEEVTLSWSVSNASDIAIEPEVGKVPPEGSATLLLEENGSYTLIASNFAGESRKVVAITVLRPLTIDGMEGSWSTYGDGRGSSIDIRSVEGRSGNATRISYDLVQDGWVGISKSVHESVIYMPDTDGVSFFLKGGGTPNSIEIVLRDRNGTSFGFSWDRATVSEDWTAMMAGYDDFECLEAKGCDEALLNLENITTVDFVISDRDRQEFGSSGWAAIDELEGFHR